MLLGCSAMIGLPFGPCPVVMPNFLQVEPLHGMWSGFCPLSTNFYQVL